MAPIGTFFTQLKPFSLMQKCGGDDVNQSSANFSQVKKKTSSSEKN